MRRSTLRGETGGQFWQYSHTVERSESKHTQINWCYYGGQQCLAWFWLWGAQVSVVPARKFTFDFPPASITHPCPVACKHKTDDLDIVYEGVFMECGPHLSNVVRGTKVFARDQRLLKASFKHLRSVKWISGCAHWTGSRDLVPFNLATTARGAKALEISKAIGGSFAQTEIGEIARSSARPPHPQTTRAVVLLFIAMGKGKTTNERYQNEPFVRMRVIAN